MSDDLFEDDSPGESYVAEPVPVVNTKLEPGFGDVKAMAESDRKNIPAPVIRGSNKVILNLNIAKFTNVEIELNDITEEGRKYIKERLELAQKYVTKYGFKEGGN